MKLINKSISICTLAVTAFGLAACKADETISGYSDPAAEYQLVRLDGQPFTKPATISFPEENRVGGQAPCNTWTANQSVPYPWIKIGPIAATRMACPNLDAERLFFGALNEMELAEISGDVLLLSNEAGREMQFERVK